MAASPDVIRSRANPLLRRLRAAAKRGGAGLLVLEGPLLVEEAAGAGLAIAEIAATPRALAAPRGRAAVAAARDRGAALRVVEERLLASLSELETSQGILALARPPRFAEEQLYSGPNPLIVVAVALQNPGNLGGLLRTAEAAGATGAYLSGGSADPFSSKALRGSMGSAFRLPHFRGIEVPEILARLKRRRVAIVAATAEARVRYDAVDWRRAAAVCFGSEGGGLPEAVRRAADALVSIPMRGAVESLNVGVAAGILLFEAARQRG